MALLDRVVSPLVAWFSPRVEYIGGRDYVERVLESVGDATDGRTLTVARLWRTQPHLRTVVSFIARNVAQCGVHVFERVGETDRRRSRTDPLSSALSLPGDGLTSYGLIYALVGDKLLYDRAYWLPYVDDGGAPRLRRLPPSWVAPVRDGAFGTSAYVVTYDGAKPVTIPADQLIVFGGYSPTSPDGCSPTVDALRDTLYEQIQAAQYRAQTWRRGGRVSSVIRRPVDAPRWSDAARERFREDWYSSYTGSGSRAGGTPLLEDGMTVERMAFSAKESEWAEGVKLALSTVAGAFHVSPTMVGVLDNANFANVREFRKMLYGDSLGPTLAEIEAVLNAFLVPMLGMDPSRMYAEFNIAEKLQGNFEETTAALQSSVGRPYMTADEARARLNLPSMGGDAAQLVTPLNVLVGGQASPRDSGPKARVVRVKARAGRPHEDRVAQVVKRFLSRQESTVRAALGAKSAPDWWDGARWDRELAEDLLKASHMVASDAAASTLDDLGLDADGFDADLMVPWIAEASKRSAASVNAATLADIEDALADEEDPDAALDDVFGKADSRSGSLATSVVTLMSSFGSVEAVKQTAPTTATKTWVAGANPRPEHEAMDGETVLLSENFSNGAAWPGDGANLGADDLAGCNCSLIMSV